MVQRVRRSAQTFLTTLDPLLTGLRARLYRHTFTADEPMGNLSAAWAKRLGLSTDVGGFDAHMGAVGADVQPYTFARVMGTLTRDMLVAPTNDVGHKLIRGICG